MGRKKKIADIPVEILEEKESPAMEEYVVDKDLEKLLDKLTVKKTTFAKLTFIGKGGPYLVAFLDEATATYADMNASECKSVSINDVKVDKIPIWECGAKTPEQINALPKLDLAKERVKADKLKADKKAARAEKMKNTIAAKAEMKKKETKKKAKK